MTSALLGRLSPYHGGARFVRADSKCTLAGVATATLHRCDLVPIVDRRWCYRELAKKAATAQSEGANSLFAIQTQLAQIQPRLGAGETILRAVE
jgi:hypothetical protein